MNPHLRVQMGWLFLLAALLRLSVAEAAAPKLFVVELPVRLDTVAAGKLVVGLKGQQLVHVDVDSWRQFAQPHLRPEFVEAVAARASDGKLLPEALLDAGVTVEYDPATLVLTAALPTESRLITELSLRRSRPGADVSADPFSTYVNVRATQGATLESSSGSQRSKAQVGFDGAARVGGAGGVAVEWSAGWREAAPTPFRRGEVRAFHDDLVNAVRYSVGDIQYGSTELQGRPPLAGVAVERLYGRLQPFRVITSTGQQSFTLTRPSRIDVFVNGQFQNTSRLNPGRYSLSDFAFLSGLNDVQIVVEDDAGVRTTLDFTLFLGAQLLSPGISEFSVSGGVQRDNGKGSIAYARSEPALSAFYRRGISSAVTLGGSYQSEEGLQVVGVDSTVGTPLGLVSLNAAGSSAAGNGRGWAGTLGWTWNFSLFSPKRGEELSLVGNYLSADYRRVGARDADANLHYLGAARFTTRLPMGTALSLNFRHIRQRDDSEPLERAVGLSIGQRLFGASLSLRADRVLRARAENRVFLNLSMPLGQGRSLLSGYDSTSEQARIDYASFAQDSVGNLSGRAQIIGNRERAGFDSDIAYRGNRAVVRGQYGLQQSMQGEGSRVQTVNAQIETSLAYTDGSFAVGRPVADSFAVLRRHPTLRGSDVQAVFGRDGVIAEADDWGPALIGTLDSYRPQSVQWTVPTPPAGYDLGDVARLVTPAQHSGRAYTVGSAASLTAVGMALHLNGDPVAKVAAVITADDGRPFAEQRSFTNRSGRFALAQLEPGRYRIEFATEPTRRSMRFTIPANAVGHVDLGVLVDADADRADGLVPPTRAIAGTPNLRLDTVWSGGRRRDPLPPIERPVATLMLRTAERLSSQDAVGTVR